MATDDKNPNVDKLIEANLRRVYDSVLREEVPDRFAALLQRLEAGEDRPAEEAHAAPASDDVKGR